MKMKRLSQTLAAGSLALTLCCCSGSGTAGSGADSTATDTATAIAASESGAEAEALAAADSAKTALEAKAAEEAEAQALADEARAFLKKAYSTKSSDGFYTTDRKYLSPELRKVVKDADKKANAEGDEVGYFDCDILTQSQDPGPMKSVDIVSVTPDVIVAKVTGEGYNTGPVGTVKVTVIRLNGKLYIDDVDGTKADAKRYLRK